MSFVCKSAMRPWFIAGALTCGAACGPATTSDTVQADAADDAVADAQVVADAMLDAGARDAGPPVAYVRFANFAPNVPAFDICFKANEAGRQFMGPLLRGAGLMGGLEYGRVSEYVSVEPRMHAWRLVSPTATDCTTPLMDSPPMLYFNPGAIYGHGTVVASGVLLGPAPNQLGATYADDAFGDAPAGMVQLSVFSAALGTGSLEMGLVTGATFTMFGMSVDYRTARNATVAALSAATVGVRRTGMTTVEITAASVTIPPTKSRSVFLYGTLADATRPLSMLICDNTQSAGHLSVCDSYPMR